MELFQNSADCPKLQLSCSRFDIPCDTEDVAVDIKVGGGDRTRWSSGGTFELISIDPFTRYCRDNPPSLVTGEYLWVFLTENLGHPPVDIDCSISCAAK